MDIIEHTFPCQQAMTRAREDECKVAENPLVVSLSNHERILIARPSTSSGLTARAFGRLCNRPALLPANATSSHTCVTVWELCFCLGISWQIQIELILGR